MMKKIEKERKLDTISIECTSEDWLIFTTCCIPLFYPEAKGDYQICPEWQDRAKMLLGSFVEMIYQTELIKEGR
jgi:hypothetical protein